MDLSYLAVVDAITQVEAVGVADDADLVALVKPQYELGLATLPTEPDQLQAAVRHASDGVERMPWKVTGVMATASQFPGPLGRRRRRRAAGRALRSTGAGGRRH